MPLNHGFSTGAVPPWGAFAQPRGGGGDGIIFFIFCGGLLNFHGFQIFWGKNRLPEINSLFSFIYF